MLGEEEKKQSSSSSPSSEAVEVHQWCFDSSWTVEECKRFAKQERISHPSLHCGLHKSNTKANIQNMKYKNIKPKKLFLE